MTSRDRSERRFRDQLGVMISWGLRESVADVAPPPGMWKRIDERLRRKARRDGQAWWPGFRIASRTATRWLLETVVGPSKEIVYCDSGEVSRMRETYLHLLMYQSDLPLLLGQAV